MYRNDFEKITEAILTSVNQLEGMLRLREQKFLITVGAHPTSPGVILEIGSYKGLSTTLLAKASAICGDEKIYATDPLIFTSNAHDSALPPTDETSAGDFYRNLKDYGVENRVEFYQMYSYDLAKTWNKTIRFLWLDGDHSYEGVKSDIVLFEDHLSLGAIIASHDIVGEHVGGTRAFREYVLSSDKYGDAVSATVLFGRKEQKNILQNKKTKNNYWPIGYFI